jgi:predicted polyphosphate/ATP-dependent NAD kinase
VRAGCERVIMNIGFIVNPIAGMGGRVGLKGTDGVVDEAIHRGATPVALGKAVETLEAFLELSANIEGEIHWFTCGGEMGAHALTKAGINEFAIVYTPRHEMTTAEDTKEGCSLLLEHGVDLVVFCGGDGTARDVFSALQTKVPMVGIPSGVKMHSGVFAITTRAAAKILVEFIRGRLTKGDAEILDLDEDRYRRGEWNIRLFGIAKGLVEPTYIQVGKTTFESLSDEDVKEELAEHVIDDMRDHQDWLYLLGSGGTIDYIAKKMNVENTLLGIDAVYQNKVVGSDLNEQSLLDLFDQYPKVKLILSPIGAQGFILGRGNLQLSPRVIRRIGIENIMVISTPSKLLATPVIRVDTGDRTLDEEFASEELMMVVIGYRLSRVVKIQTNNF